MGSAPGGRDNGRRQRARCVAGRQRVRQRVGVWGVRYLLTSSFAQATDRPLLGVNGLDMAGLRPFDLVIPFTIKKGEITGEGG